MLQIAIGLSNAEVAQKLILKGANVNATNIKYGQTPLHLAAQAGNGSIVDMLIQKEANVNARDNNWDTPLHVAIKERYTNIVTTLINNGADINMINKQGKSPLDLANDSTDQKIMQALTKAQESKNPNSSTGDSKTPTDSNTDPHTNQEAEAEVEIEAEEKAGEDATKESQVTIADKTQQDLVAQAQNQDNLVTSADTNKELSNPNDLSIPTYAQDNNLDSMAKNTDVKTQGETPQGQNRSQKSNARRPLSSLATTEGAKSWLDPFNQATTIRSETTIRHVNKD